MLLVLKPLVMTMWRSRAFKELIIAMLERIVTRTDNDLDDLAVSISRTCCCLTHELKSRWRRASSKYPCCWCWACCHSCRFLNAFPKMRPTAWLLLNSLRSPCRRNYWRKTQSGSRLGRQVAMTKRSTCPTSSNSTTRQALATASASAQRCHGGSVL